MSRVPYLVENARWGLRLGHQELTDGMYRDGFHCMLADQVMGETAETLATMHGISRDEQDRFALSSQQRAGAAEAAERFDQERIPVQVSQRGQTETFSIDEHVRAGVTLDNMGKLPPVFSQGGSVTAGNSSGITDGAAVTVLASADAVARHHLQPLARIIDYAVAGVDPRIMGIGPVPATRKLLSKTGMKLDDFGLVELNEAFAAQVLACLAAWQDKDFCQQVLGLDQPFGAIARDRLNVDGGAISLGHPVGTSGNRIVLHLVNAMKRLKMKRGIATECIGGGQGGAMLLEMV
jgi:acetyl-CoA C-acetyltransferase